ncbi:hypothetical protein P700755_003405 [Psychroflexus torquis ATCC 700755]|uniref:Uncharacterized protein n=1 Tax=Psychroflexus torquis (strain ATCC 700755 / CIP 106069 / ACAM 623) TaxID=313595 RepID=K4ILV5_PSYTT|nr:hypothetical protein P700755_003405 [Psychroflexus torquis ATCC 700755]
MINFVLIKSNLPEMAGFFMQNYFQNSLRKTNGGYLTFEHQIGIIPNYIYNAV